MPEKISKQINIPRINPIINPNEEKYIDEKFLNYPVPPLDRFYI